MPNFGKTFIVGFPDSELNPELANKLQKINPAGVILFDINFKSPEQIFKLSTDLKNLLGEDLIISTDEEGGKVQRLRRFVSPLPSFAALGLNPDHSNIQNFTTLLSTNLRKLNFNLAYSPCADLNTEPLNPIIGPRSFGSDVNQVAEQVEVFIRALKQTSILSCAKHFPGHGASLSDSHHGLPKITYPNYQEFAKHLEPFKAAIKANTDMIMIAHLAIEILGDDKFTSEKDLPTSLSKKFIIDLLREELNFQGVTVSDEITMKALDRFGNCSQRAQLMLAAGNDLITWNTNIDEALQASTDLNQLNTNQNLINMFEQAQARIQKLKTRKKPNTPSAEINQLEAEMLAIAKAAINNPRGIKINPTSTILLYNKHPKLERDIIDRIFPIPKMEFSEEKNPCEFALDKFENIIVLEFQTALNPKLSEYLAKLKQQRAKTYIISTDVLSPHADLILNGSGQLHYNASWQSMTVHSV